MPASKLPAPNLPPFTGELDSNAKLELLRQSVQAELDKIVIAVNNPSLPNDLDAGENRIKNLTNPGALHDAVNFETLKRGLELLNRNINKNVTTTIRTIVGGSTTLKVRQWTLDSATTTVTNPTGVIVGDEVLVVGQQDATGGRLLAWDTNFKLPVGGIQQPAGTPSYYNLYRFYVLATDTLLLSGQPIIGVPNV